MLGRKEGTMIGIHTNIPGIQVLAGRSRQEMHERQKIHMSENAGVHFGVPRDSVCWVISGNGKGARWYGRRLRGVAHWYIPRIRVLGHVGNARKVSYKSRNARKVSV